MRGRQAACAALFAALALLLCCGCGEKSAEQPEQSRPAVSPAPPVEAAAQPAEPPAGEAAAENGGSGDIVLTLAGTPVQVDWAQNSSVDALRSLLQKGGPLTLEMSDYGGFEKGAPLPETLPQNNEPMETDAGDVILYQGRQFVVYYDRNSWQLTPLGKIAGMTKPELQELLGAGDVTATLSLEAASAPQQ